MVNKDYQSSAVSTPSGAPPPRPKTKTILVLSIALLDVSRSKFHKFSKMYGIKKQMTEAVIDFVRF